jgi:hypothetical protein
MMATPPNITGEDVSQADQAIHYELTTLAFHLPDADTAKVGIDPWVNAPDAHGHLVGCWEACRRRSTDGASDFPGGTSSIRSRL